MPRMYGIPLRRYGKSKLVLILLFIVLTTIMAMGQMTKAVRPKYGRYDSLLSRVSILEREDNPDYKKIRSLLWYAAKMEPDRPEAYTALSVLEKKNRTGDHVELRLAEKALRAARRMNHWECMLYRDYLELVREDYRKRGLIK